MVVTPFFLVRAAEWQQTLVVQMSTCVLFTKIFRHQRLLSLSLPRNSPLLVEKGERAQASVAAMPFNKIEEQKHGTRTQNQSTRSHSRRPQQRNTVSEQNRNNNKNAEKIIIALPLVAFGTFEHTNRYCCRQSDAAVADNSTTIVNARHNFQLL